MFRKIMIILFVEGIYSWCNEQVFAKCYFHFLMNTPIINLKYFYCSLLHNKEIEKDIKNKKNLNYLI